jgi:hypothetical protein
MEVHKKEGKAPFSDPRQPHCPQPSISISQRCGLSRVRLSLLLTESLLFDALLSTMFVLPVLIPAFLGATISWASPAPTTTSDILNTPGPANDSVVPPTPDLGINCRGSLYCSYGEVSASADLTSWILGISDDAWYNNGQQIGASFYIEASVFHDILIVFSVIACTGANICAFLQATNGANGKWIKTIAPYIRAHQCNTCGSVSPFIVKCVTSVLTFLVWGHQ